MDKRGFYPELAAFIAARIAEQALIAAARRERLRAIADNVRTCQAASQPARLVFVCTHNSRRSQFGQVWAAAAADWHGIAGVEAFSAGTEVTAFNPNAVAALQRAGLMIDSDEAGANPAYRVRWGPAAAPLTCFSKVISHPVNPHTDFAAVMTCSEADAACPLVPGAAARFSLPYDDPKSADGTPGVAAVYDERCGEVARELLFLFDQVR